MAGAVALLAEFFKRRNAQRAYAVDSLPVAVCDNSSASAAAAGFTLQKSSTKRFAATHPQQAALLLRFARASSGSDRSRRAGGGFFGGGFGDRCCVFKELELDLPEGSIICADKAYTDYD